jgi:hypothetical protein
MGNAENILSSPKLRTGFSTAERLPAVTGGLFCSQVSETICRMLEVKFESYL